MDIKIKKIDADNYEVNGKPVFKDASGNWVAKATLTTKEVEHFQKHIFSNSKTTEQ